MTALGIKQAELAAVMKKLADLDSDLAEKVARKESLEAEVEMCKIKLDRWGCRATSKSNHLVSLVATAMTAGVRCTSAPGGANV
jgi:hypothetical protein